MAPPPARVAPEVSAPRAATGLPRTATMVATEAQEAAMAVAEASAPALEISLRPMAPLLVEAAGEEATRTLHRAEREPVVRSVCHSASDVDPVPVAVRVD